jgi:hypothetical protein
MRVSGSARLYPAGRANHPGFARRVDPRRGATRGKARAQGTERSLVVALRSVLSDR